MTRKRRSTVVDDRVQERKVSDAQINAFAAAASIDGAFRVQPAIWLQPGITTEMEAHFRLFGPVGVSTTKSIAEFAPGGMLSTSTYYNVFNLGKWRRNSGVIPLELQLRGQGRFQLTVFQADRHRSWHQITSEIVTLDGLSRVPVEPDRDTPAESLLFFDLTAIDPGVLEDFAWATTAKPQRIPELMLSVTTFRREVDVEHTIKRFREFHATSELRDHLRMLIVDNDSSLSVTNGGGVEIIANENLGGAGGFTRGLLRAREIDATHCLFMDDDASIQMEAISRTWWFLAYAKAERTAVAGAMINATHRWQIWENGAEFDLGCKPRFGGLDLRALDAVFAMEYATTGEAPEDLYAGWWFFAFPISAVEHLPFPFFVRGDDVSFSLANDFDIVSLPGVASVQENFMDKASPLTWYLDFRSHLVHHLTLSDKERSWPEVKKMVRSFYVRNVMRLHYDTLSAINLAFEDVMRGPKFFDENADMAQRRADIKKLSRAEKWRSIPQAPEELFAKPPGFWKRFFLTITLNGQLVPFSSRVGSKLVLTSPFRDDYRKVYGAREVTYLNADQSKAYTVRRSQRRFLHETLRLLKNSRRLKREYAQQMTQWRAGYDTMTADPYWVEKLHLAPAES